MGFLGDDRGKCGLLEVNAFPDFGQTGDDLRRIVEGVWEGVVRVVVGGFFGIDVKGREGQVEKMVLVRSVDLGRR